MRSVNIAFSKNVYKFLHEMIGKNFAKIACNKFVYSNSVYGIVGIYVGELIYKVTNFVDAIDYYGKLEDVAVFKLEEASENEIISAVQNEEMVDIPVGRIIKKIEVINENQIQYKAGDVLYDNWVTRGIIFYFEDGEEISFEKDIWFSEEILIERGRNLLGRFSSTEEFSEAWESDDENVKSLYSGKATREVVSIF